MLRRLPTGVPAYLISILCTMCSLTRGMAQSSLQDISESLSAYEDSIHSYALAAEDSIMALDANRPYEGIPTKTKIRQWASGDIFKADIVWCVDAPLLDKHPDYEGYRKQVVFDGKHWIEADTCKKNNGVTFGIIGTTRPAHRPSLKELVTCVGGTLPYRSIILHDGYAIVGEDVIAGERCIVIDGLSQRKAIRMKLWYNPKYKLMVQTEVYGGRDELLEITRYKDVRELVPGIWIPFTVQIDNPKHNNRNVIALSECRINTELPKDVFSIDWGKEGRVYDTIIGQKYRLGPRGNAKLESDDDPQVLEAIMESPFIKGSMRQTQPGEDPMGASDYRRVHRDITGKLKSASSTHRGKWLSTVSLIAGGLAFGGVGIVIYHVKKRQEKARAR